VFPGTGTEGIRFDIVQLAGNSWRILVYVNISCHNGRRARGSLLLLEDNYFRNIPLFLVQTEKRLCSSSAEG
jgi:hypothetical protein